MKLIYRYLLGKLLLPLGCILTGFTLLYVIYDMVDKSSDFIEHDFPAVAVFRYYALQLPSFLTLIIPAALLLGVLYSLARLSRHHEITAMRATGISIYRLAGPYLVVGLVASAATFLINERYAPDAAWRAEQLMAYHESDPDERSEVYFAAALPLKLPRRNRDWFVERFDTRDYTMHGVTMTQQHPGGSATEYETQRALWIDGRWWFMDVTVREFDADGNLKGAPEFALQKEMTRLTENPRDFLSVIKPTEFMSAAELRHYLRRNPQLSDEVRARKRTDLMHRLATPWVCVIVVLLGIPVGAHTGRQGVFAGVATTLLFFFGYYLCQLTGEALAKKELLDPVAGAGAPVLIFLVIGAALVYRMR
ncbi:LptF/LptG family permease [Kiritimatiella glycovorans]|uniref:Lipopolysaccharide ABC transporter permease LptF n=1 Tax=Kiritimatiella glycovorans TaxID=1307763 RepID=A0A0G3EHD0_9BACT|nr:LptF/LptG family permease [Kiritimatiella glycovorans]AKJ64245.1 lipopolysaccharide ABC transporter permease LptF [Kiritimatiella glycovorans]